MKRDLAALRRAEESEAVDIEEENLELSSKAKKAKRKRTASNRSKKAQQYAPFSSIHLLAILTSDTKRTQDTNYHTKWGLD
jgi:hypothetical protein